MRRALALWFAAFAVFDAVAYRLVPPAIAQYDFTSAGRVVGHFTDRALTPFPIVQNTPAAWPLWLAFCAAYVTAFAAYRVLCRSRVSAPALAIALACGGAAMFFVPYLPTSDPYAYALYGLEGGPLHLDPYVSQIIDPGRSPWVHALTGIFPDATDYVRTCNYGPAFVFAYALLAHALSRGPLLGFLVGERALGLFALGVTAILIAISDPGDRGKRNAVRFALHPLVLFEFVAFAHGDVLMFALLAGAYYAWKRSRPAGAAALCVLAVGVRSVAALALAALLLFVLRRRRDRLAPTLLATILTALFQYVASRWWLGGFSLGGAPRFNAYSSPSLALASAFGLHERVVIGFGAGAIAGACIAVVLARRWWLNPRSDAPAWFPWAAIVAVPSVFPHYLSWPLATAALDDGVRMNRVTNVATALAPLLYITHMNLFAAPGPPPAVYAAVLTIFWGAVIASLLVRAQNATPTPPQAIPDEG